MYLAFNSIKSSNFIFLYFSILLLLEHSKPKAIDDFDLYKLISSVSLRLIV